MSVPDAISKRQCVRSPWWAGPQAALLLLLVTQQTIKKQEKKLLPGTVAASVVNLDGRVDGVALIPRHGPMHQPQVHIAYIKLLCIPERDLLENWRRKPFINLLPTS